MTEDFKAYGVGNTHRHLAEMRSVLEASGADADLIFTPHLLPVARGILATITVQLTEPTRRIRSHRGTRSSQASRSSKSMPSRQRFATSCAATSCASRRKHVAGVRQPTLHRSSRRSTTW